MVAALENREEQGTLTRGYKSNEHWADLNFSFLYSVPWLTLWPEINSATKIGSAQVKGVVLAQWIRRISICNLKDLVPQLAEFNGECPLMEEFHLFHHSVLIYLIQEPLTPN